jgi:hypothetical protein
MFTINSKIDAIKLIRAFIGMGLKDAKIVVEAWEKAFDNNFHTSSLHEILILGSICTMICNGEWTINDQDEIVVRKAIGKEDILKLR